MNEFQIYELLSEMSRLAGQYNDGMELSQRLRECADRTASQLYRVAVIGEFKRGKSSMINALLGTEVLPTSILPMTAAVTRVTYGEEKRISVLYKDGTTESATIGQLIDFATKRDAEKAERAARIKEITVFYPSVFCKNHIDLIDTPGLNDDEAMTAVTLGVVGEIDAAIMVVSAMEPLSITEQDLILTMIAEQGIRHIVFVVTYIDAVSDDTDDQDKMIAYIKRRISSDLLKRAEAKFSEDPALLEKSRRILSSPDIFGVSSVLALQGFTTDSEELLKLSRFPKFKKELLDLLTAAQSIDTRLNVTDYAAEIRTALPEWYKNEVEYLNTSRTDIIERQKKNNLNFMNSERELNSIKLAFSRGIAQLGLDSIKTQAQKDEFVNLPAVKRYKLGKGNYRFSLYEVLDRIKEVFIERLYTVKHDGYTTEAVAAALSAAEADAGSIMAEFSAEVQETIAGQFELAYASVSEKLPESDPDSETDSHAALDALRSEWENERPFPELKWSVSPIPEEEVLVGADVIVTVKKAIINSVTAYADSVREYIEAWKTALTDCYQNVFADKRVIVRLANELSAKNAKLLTVDTDFKKHTERIGEIAKQLGLPGTDEDTEAENV